MVMSKNQSMPKSHFKDNSASSRNQIKPKSFDVGRTTRADTEFNKLKSAQSQVGVFEAKPDIETSVVKNLLNPKRAHSQAGYSRQKFQTLQPS